MSEDEVVGVSIADQIEWPETPALRDEAEWSRNVGLVKALSGMAEDVVWQDGVKGKDTYTHMPKEYRVNGLNVQFLPHWGYYSIDGRNFGLPRTSESSASVDTFIEVLKADIDHARSDADYLKQRQQKLTAPSVSTS